MAMRNVWRCQHLKVNGTQCGSPALKWRRLCFFHENMRRERVQIARQHTTYRYDLPLLEDANCIQIALMKVIQMLGAGSVDHKTAGLMLYGLQTASINLRHCNFEAEDATEIVIDRDKVPLTDIGGPLWDENDFQNPQEDEEKEEAESEATEAAGKIEEGDAAPVAAAPAKTAPARKAPTPVEHITVEEARKRVKGVVHDWILETLGAKDGAKPPG